jgi:hypothetical protein
MGKTIRFSDLVHNSGRPQFVTLWTAPEKDARMSHAMKANRVLTVIEEPGQRPHGLLGLHPGPHSLFLIFPRPLALDPQGRVVGMNYALAEQPQVKDPVVVPEPRPKSKPPQTAKHKPLLEPAEPPPPPKPVKKTFTVRLRRTATIEETRQLEAGDRAEAERQALEEARAEDFDLNKATVREELVR